MQNPMPAPGAPEILLIEDDEGHLLTLADILESEGLNPINCQTGHEALEACDRFHAHVAILDLRLSDIDGLQLLDLLLQKSPQLKVIIHTGYASLDTAMAAVNRGAFAYVEKVGNVEELLAHVHRAFHLHLATSAFLSGSNPSVAMVDNPLEPPRFVLFMLRGGLDGLSTVPPYADPDYARLRPRLIASSHEERLGIVKLDNQFGLHPAMAPLKAWYDAGEMLIVHATGMPYQPRSHVAAQQIFERGTLSEDTRDGWLNRALHGLPHGASLGLAVGRVVPLILRGQGSIHTFAPP